MGKADAVKAPDKITNGTVAGLLMKMSDELNKALPRHVPVEKFIRVALTTIRKNPRILDCSRHSIIASIMQSAQLGLQVDGVLGEAYLVPFKGECTLIPGYKGLISLARRSGKVTSFDAHCVYEKDSFSFRYGTNKFLDHTPALEDRGNLIAVYAIGKMTDGEFEFDVMSKGDVDKIRANAPGKNSDAWKNHEDMMSQKTVIRRWAKLRPLSPEFQRAAELSEREELGLDLKEATVSFRENPLAALSAGDPETHTQPGDPMTETEKQEAIELENAYQKEL
jgi:recombination protein RecT